MLGLVTLILLLLILIGLALYTVLIYNGFIRMRNEVDKTWSNIDVLLKQRFDELPKLIKVCEGYMQHEQKTLEAVTRARSQVASARSDQEKLGAQNMLTDTLRSLFAVAESYPALKADAVFQRLGYRISELEDQIADRRELFNESVTLFNIRLEQFPDLIVARLFGFTGRTLWKIDPAHRQDVEVKFQPA
ncbi:MAG: LemA family protein [Desulfuromonadales bacterium]|nr:LemA family protein [Desulfuromonadales bacterium]